MMEKRTTAAEAVDRERGKRIKQARKSKGITQTEMASHLGITLQAYQRYEYGNELRSSVIISLCAKLECSPSWMLGIKDEGKSLEDNDPLMVALRERCDELNLSGQKKIVEYASDLACNPKYQTWKQS